MLIHGYYYIDPELVLPTVRGNIEKECTLIAQGKAELEDVVDHSLQVFKEKFVFFKEHIAVSDRVLRYLQGMDTLFESEFSLLTESGKPLSRCGICKRFMRYVKSPPPRLYCSECNVT